MPNIKSQIKRDATNKAANAANSAAKARSRTASKKVEALVAEGKAAEAKVALSEAISLLDQLAQAGIIAKNNATRKKAHLQHIVAGIEAK
ncbi:MAG: 30S ribosomal protein S20 [Bacilli bacterium]|nr:30S ribosomal protein S20 [Bacilli bacterium]